MNVLTQNYALKEEMLHEKSTCFDRPAAVRLRAAHTMAADANAAESRTVIIVMYHSILQDQSRSGKYVISPKVFESDLQWLLDNGYETVTLGDLLAFVQGSGELPQKPVVLTFDDGHLNTMTYALPILEALDCRAVLSVVGAYTEKSASTSDHDPNYAYVTWKDIKALNKSGRFEIQNHSYAMHGQGDRLGSTRKVGESKAEYADAFTKDVTRLQEALKKRCGVTPRFFTYPYGLTDPESAELLAEMGFCGSMTCYEKANVITVGDMACLWRMGRFNRASGTTSEQFMRRITK